MTVADRIKNRRLELKLSQEELALKAGYSGKTAISKLEHAGNDLTMKQIRRLARALSVTDAYLMGWEDGSGDTDHPIGHISNEDQALLEQYHHVSAETRAAIDLLLRADQRNS